MIALSSIFLQNDARPARAQSAGLRALFNLFIVCASMMVQVALWILVSVNSPAAAGAAFIGSGLAIVAAAFARR